MLPFCCTEAASGAEGARLVHFVRHGEAEHNVASRDAALRGIFCLCAEGRDKAMCPFHRPAAVDSGLSARGLQEAQGLAKVAPSVGEVYVSPHLRALQTAVVMYPNGPRVVAHPALRPVRSHHFQSRLPSLACLAQRFPTVDLSQMGDVASEQWDAAESRESVNGRVEAFLAEILAAGAEGPAVAVVSHFTVFLAMTLHPRDARLLGALSDSSRPCPLVLTPRGDGKFVSPGGVRSMWLKQCVPTVVPFSLDACTRARATPLPFDLLMEKADMLIASAWYLHCDDAVCSGEAMAWALQELSAFHPGCSLSCMGPRAGDVPLRRVEFTDSGTVGGGPFGALCDATRTAMLSPHFSRQDSSWGVTVVVSSQQQQDQTLPPRHNRQQQPLALVMYCDHRFFDMRAVFLLVRHLLFLLTSRSELVLHRVSEKVPRLLNYAQMVPAQPHYSPPDCPAIPADHLAPDVDLASQGEDATADFLLRRLSPATTTALRALAGNGVRFGLLLQSIVTICEAAAMVVSTSRSHKEVFTVRARVICDLSRMLTAPLPQGYLDCLVSHYTTDAVKVDEDLVVGHLARHWSQYHSEHGIREALYHASTGYTHPRYTDSFRVSSASVNNIGPTFVPTQLPGVRVSGMGLTGVRSVGSSKKGRLKLYCFTHADALSLNLSYCRDSYRRKTVQTFAELFELTVMLCVAEGMDCVGFGRVVRQYLAGEHLLSVPGVLRLSDSANPESAANIAELVSQHLAICPKVDISPVTDHTLLVRSYPDHVHQSDRPGLETVAKLFGDHLEGAKVVHHVLPPFSSDGDEGFSVTDYSRVRSDLGPSHLLSSIADASGLMLDVVLNHCSTSHPWFQDVLTHGTDSRYASYFHLFPQQPTVPSRMVRARHHPLFTKFQCENGQVLYAWTTYSPQQVDLAWSQCPSLVYEFCAIILRYALTGCSALRLDAFMYIFKDLQNPQQSFDSPRCMLLLRVFRAFLKACGLENIALLPSVTNTIASQLGKFLPHCGLLYNCPFSALALYSSVTGDVAPLGTYLAEAFQSSVGGRFVNVLTTHDGIGLNWLAHVLPQPRISQFLGLLGDLATGKLCTTAPPPPLKIVYRTREAADTRQQPWEVNCNVFEISQFIGNHVGVGGRGGDRHVAIVALTLALPGVPLLYLPLLFPAPGQPPTGADVDHFRSINRRRYSGENWFDEALFEQIRHLVQLRGDRPYFAEEASCHVAVDGPGVIRVTRVAVGDTFTGVFNLSLDHDAQFTVQKGGKMVACSWELCGQGRVISDLQLTVPASAFAYVEGVVR